MIIECIRNDGFEDQLTAEGAYRVQEMGDNSYLIENDNEEARWYGRQHFRLNTEH